jgi:hypothetical protein
MKKKTFTLLTLLSIFLLSLNLISCSESLSYRYKWKLNIGPDSEDSKESRWLPQPSGAEYENGILYTTYGKKFMAINVEDGKEVFKIIPPPDYVFCLCEIDEDSIYLQELPRNAYDLFGEKRKYILRIGKEDGKVKWEVKSCIGQIKLTEKEIIVYSWCGIYFLSKETGKEEFFYPLKTKLKDPNGFALTSFRYSSCLQNRFLIYIGYIPSLLTKVEIVTFDVFEKKEINHFILNIDDIPFSLVISGVKIHLLDEKSIIFELELSTSEFSSSPESAKIVKLDYLTGDKEWESTFNTDKIPRSIFTLPNIDEYYYLLTRNGEVFSLSRLTGTIGEQIFSSPLLISDYISLPVFWRKYAIFRDINNVFIFDLLEKKVIVNIEEGSTKGKDYLSKNITFPFCNPIIIEGEDHLPVMDVLLSSCKPILIEKESSKEAELIALLDENIYCVCLNILP